MSKRSGLANILRSDFARHIATLVSGTTLAQAVPIIVSPILTRIYSTEEYALLAMFMSVSAMIAIIADFQYPNAVLLAREEADSIQVLLLCLVLVVAIALVSGLFMWLGNEWLAEMLNYPEIANWLYLVPLAVLLTGLIQVFTYWANRNSKYARLSSSGVVAALITAGFSLGLGFAGYGVLGLVVGFLMGQVARAAILVGLALRNEPEIIRSPDWKQIKQQAQHFKKFPLFTLPAEFVNVLVNRLPVLMLSIFMTDKGPIGLFNMTMRILGLPSQLISRAVGAVFKQKASQEYHETGRANKAFLLSFKLLLGLAIIPFGILFIFAPDLFAFVFGEPWRGSGVYAQCLTLMFFMRFITSPLTYMFAIVSAQKEDFLMHIVLLGILFGTLYFGLAVWTDEVLAFWLFSGGYTLIYLYYLVRSYQFSRGNS